MRRRCTLTEGRIQKYDATQPRDANGEFASGGGTSPSAVKAQEGPPDKRFDPTNVKLTPIEHPSGTGKYSGGVDHATKPLKAYAITDKTTGQPIGRVYQVEHSTTVYAGNSRVRVGTRYSKAWQADTRPVGYGGTVVSYGHAAGYTRPKPTATTNGSRSVTATKRTTAVKDLATQISREYDRAQGGSS